jgi:hypothetical protein
MKLAIATILRDFDITTVDTEDGGPAQELMKFAMAPVGLTMRLRVKACDVESDAERDSVRAAERVA